MSNFFNPVFEGNFDFVTVFEGDFEHAAKYIEENFSDSKWFCPTGEEDAEGIIDVLYAGCFQPGLDDEIIIEIDNSGNIRAKGDAQVFAKIV